MANLQNTIIDDTSFLEIPEGSTSSRPQNPLTGFIQFNTDYNLIEFFDGNFWKNTKNTIITNTTGSVEITQKGNYKIYAYKGTGQFNILEYSGFIDILVVAGGGAGGSHVGAGGGAGGLIFEKNYEVFPGDSFNIVVGAGGFRERNNIDGCGQYSAACRAQNGQNSSFGNITAIGGGRGGSWSFSNADGGTGGSGGGAAQTGVGSGTSGQGFDGGTPRIRMGSPNTAYITGGGGGAGEQGFSNQPHSGRTFSNLTLLGSSGGNGLYFGDVFGDLFGDRGWFAGGGGGGIHGGGASCGHVGVDASNGGLGGGGRGRCNGGRNTYNIAGTVRGAQEALEGMANTGGGGGGDGDAGGRPTRSGSGGSGIVIVRHRI